MPNRSLAIGTSRRPRASVTSRRASGMDRGEVYQNNHGVYRPGGDVQPDQVVVSRREQPHGNRGEDREHYQQQHQGGPAPPDLDRPAHRVGGGGTAAVADDSLVGDFGSAVSTGHPLRMIWQMVPLSRGALAPGRGSPYNSYQGDRARQFHAASEGAGR